MATVCKAGAVRTGFVAAATAFAVTMLGTTLPTPLYPLYQHSLHFGELTVTVVFAAYAVGVLLALSLFGGLSDRIGRRPVLLTALALSALSALCFLLEGGLAALFVGRVLSGLSAGLFTGTGTATLLDLAGDDPAARSRASLVATCVNVGGLGAGPLLAGFVSTAFGAPLRVVYVVDLVAVSLAAVAFFRLPETVTVTGRRTRSTWLQPVRLALPREVAGVFVPAGIAGFAGFVILGLFTSVSPAALAGIYGVHNRIAVGAVVLAVFTASAVGQLSTSRAPAGRALLIGCLVLALGMVVFVVGLRIPSLSTLLIGGVIAGVGQGLSFRAGMLAVNATTPPAERGAVTSLFFIVLYVGISLPVIAVGFGARADGIRSAGTVAGIAVAALAVLAAAALEVLDRGRTAA